MANVVDRTTVLRGLSFSIADLVLITGWSEAHGLQMDVQLDHGSETEEYEEVIRFRSLSGRRSRWIIWRDAEAVFVQPLLGRSQRHGSIAEALTALTPHQTVIVTDVKARRWPD